VRVAIVGGTGSFGAALARRLREGGVEVVIGSRVPARAAAAAAELGVRGAINVEAVAGADLVVMATSAEAVLHTAHLLRGEIGPTPVLSVASELRFTPGGVVPPGSGTSIAERLQRELAGPVVAGFHTLAASSLGRTTAPNEDVLVCGDDADAKAIVLGLAGHVTSGRAFDAGPLAGARTLEGLTALLVNVNRSYGVRAGLRITGVE
jgi:NADPH-dependent F420 reductase